MVIEGNEFVVASGRVAAQHPQVVQVTRQRRRFVRAVIGACHGGHRGKLCPQIGFSGPATQRTRGDGHYVDAVPPCTHAFETGMDRSLRPIAGARTRKLVVLDGGPEDAIF